MRVDFLKNILRQIEKEVTCARCSASFSAKDISITLIEKHHTSFQGKCSLCHEISHINATIEMQQQSNTSSPDKILLALTKKLESFRGRDIRKLF